MAILYSRIPKSLWVILAVAAAVRFLGAWSGSLMYDESAQLAWAETIDLRPSHFQLVFRSVEHPLLSVYIVRLSGYLFGNDNFGLRILHVLFGTATVAVVFLFGKKAFSEKAGLWAAALFAVDQFHQTWSYFIVPEVLLLFFASLVLLQFLHATDTRSRRDFILLGAFLGFCYLAKETALLLIPILWISLLIDPDRRGLIRSSNWYLTHAIALLVVSPDIIWNLTHFYEGYFYRDITLISPGFNPSPRSGVLYLGEIVAMITGPYGGFRTTYATQNPALIHWSAGLLYLFATLGAVRLWRQWPIRVLLLTFFGYALFITIVPAPSPVENNWWWPSISFLPSVVFAGHSLHCFTGISWERSVGPLGQRLPRHLAILLVCYLGIHAVSTALRPGVGVPRRPAPQILKESLEKARQASSPDEIRRTDWLLFHTLHVVGPNADLYAYLSRAAYERGQLRRAIYFVSRSLELEATNELAISVSLLINNSSGLSRRKAKADIRGL